MEKSYFKILGLPFFSKLDWGSYIVSMIKLLNRKLESIFVLWGFFLLLLLCLYKSIKQSCMEYSCHVWAGASNCYLEMLDKLQKQIWGTARPPTAAFLEPLAQRWNVVSLSLFYSYHFGRYLSELAQMVPFPYSWVWSTRYSDRLYDFSITISIFHKDDYVNSFFSCT